MLFVKTSAVVHAQLLEQLEMNVIRSGFSKRIFVGFSPTFHIIRSGFEAKMFRSTLARAERKADIFAPHSLEETIGSNGLHLYPEFRISISIG